MNVHRISLLGRRGNTISIVASGKGPVLFLLHGFPLDHRLWQSQLETLSERYHVIAPEMGGFGQSTLEESGYTIADLADDVELVRVHLASEQKITLCGLSMGGYVAFEYWSRFPGNLTALILANTKPTSDGENARVARMAMAQRAVEEGAWPAVSGMMDKLLNQTQENAKSVARQTTEEMLRGASASAISAAQNAMAGRRDFVADLPRIAVPTLVIGGQYDALATPEETRDWAARIPGARLEILAGCGHLSALEDPRRFNSSLAAFLDSVAAIDLS